MSNKRKKKMTYNQNVKKMSEEYLHFYFIKMIFAFFFIGIFAFLNWREWV